MGPRHNLSLCVEAAEQAMVGILPVKIVLNVVLARPQELHRFLDLARHLPGFSRVIPFRAAPEGSARERHMNDHFVLRKARERGDLVLNHVSPLRRRPNLDFAVAHMNSGIHRLHRGVSREWQFIGCFDLFCGFVEALASVSSIKSD